MLQLPLSNEAGIWDRTSNWSDRSDDDPPNSPYIHVIQTIKQSNWWHVMLVMNPTNTPTQHIPNMLQAVCKNSFVYSRSVSACNCLDYSYNSHAGWNTADRTACAALDTGKWTSVMKKILPWFPPILSNRKFLQPKTHAAHEKVICKHLLHTPMQQTIILYAPAAHTYAAGSIWSVPTALT